MKLTVAKISNANLYKVYTGEENPAERKFVAMLDAVDEDELIAMLPSLIVEENEVLKERYFFNLRGIKVGKMNYVENVTIKDVFDATIAYAEARKESVA